MIIPTAQFDPMFADDGIPFRQKMVDYIRREFSDVLGDRAGLLNSEIGLAQLAKSSLGSNAGGSPETSGVIIQRRAA